MAFPLLPSASIFIRRTSRVAAVPLLLVAAGFLSCSCSDPGEVPAEVTPNACSESSDAFLQIGRILESQFVEFQEGDELELAFASQSGMEASVSLRSSGIVGRKVTQITCQLLFEGAPLGEAKTSGESLACEEETSLLMLQTAILIDVGGHPTVTSIAQIDGKVADLHVFIEGASGVLAEQTMPVILVL